MNGRRYDTGDASDPGLALPLTRCMPSCTPFTLLRGGHPEARGAAYLFLYFLYLILKEGSPQASLYPRSSASSFSFAL